MNTSLLKDGIRWIECLLKEDGDRKAGTDPDGL